MNRIIVKCDKCGEELVTNYSHVDNMGDIVIITKPCSDLNCRDCTGCEEHDKLKRVVAAIDKIIKG